MRHPGWRGFWLGPASPSRCTFCRADLGTGTIEWFSWPRNLRIASFIAASAVGIAVCERRRRKRTLLGGSAGLLLLLLLAGCASSGTQSPAQRRMQAEALRENSERLKLVTAGASKADVENALGLAGNRQIFREGSAEVQLWTYPIDAGYARLKFRDGKLVEQSTQQTSLTFARDTTVPFTQKDLDVHAALALVKLGWTKPQVERLPVKAAIRMNEKETAEVIAKMRKMLAESGADLTETNRDLRGEMWMYLGNRLNGSLLFRNGKVVEISFSEQPTKAQQDEIMQRR